MYRNVNEMYEENISIKFCNMMAQNYLNLKYSKVVDLKEHYNFANNHFQI